MPTLTGWIDYDRPHLASLSASERIDYFEKRTRLVSLNPLNRLLLHEVHPKDASGNDVPDSSALLILGVAACCSIESLGKFVNGGTGGNHDRFKAFLHAYMHNDYQAKSISADNYGQILWKSFRNGLAHGFAVCHGGYEGNAGDPYFTIKAGALEINPTLLLDDLQTGFNNYLSALRAVPTTDTKYVNFDHVFCDVFINGN